MITPNINRIFLLCDSWILKGWVCMPSDVKERAVPDEETEAIKNIKDTQVKQ